jgi:beta-glucosidase-like glycosyl hydrolase/CubicO group peptidase (beta-lactamase class C family)
MLRIHYITLTLFIFLIATVNLSAKPTIDTAKREQWVDSIMGALNTRERIAQLFMVACYPSLGAKHVDKIVKHIEQDKVGGLLFSVGRPVQIAQLTNYFQILSEVPLLMSIDGEWGVAMRVDSTPRFPQQMALGAIKDNQLIYDMGVEVAKQCSALGIQLNFAPVLDVNNNPDNPVINTRSFGENKYKVAEKGSAYMRGMQDYGLLTSAKHFPGHGDTNQDSHHELPQLNQSAEHIDSLELYPFKQLIAESINGVMVGHLDVPALDDTPDVPATLSKKIITDLLIDSLGFKGLIYTDALNMKGITNNEDSNRIPLLALMAGTDILLHPDKVTSAIDEIERAIDSSLITKEKVNYHCKKVLRAKYDAGLYRDVLIKTDSLTERLNNPEAKALNYRLAEAALTLIENQNDILPLKRLDTLKIAYLEIGEERGSTFKSQLQLYADIITYSIPKKAAKKIYTDIEKQLQRHNLIIVGYHDADSRPQYNFGVDSTSFAFIERLAASKKIIFSFFGTPYAVTKMKNPKRYAAIIISYNNSDEAQNRTAQAIFGGVKVNGTLPVSIRDWYAEGFGIELKEQTRLKYILPEEIGIPSSSLAEIDSMVNNAITQKAMPGGQVIAVYKGNVFYNKTFGKHSYDEKSPAVKLNDLYDVASVTKVSAMLPVIMKAVNDKKLGLDDSLEKHLPYLAGTNKANLNIRDILTHQSGLQAWIPYYRHFYKERQSGKEIYSDKPDSEHPNRLLNQPQCLSNTSYLDPDYFSRTRSAKYSLMVSDSLFATPAVADYVITTTDKAELQEKKYRYSDMGLMYMQRVVEAIYNKSLDKLDDELFYLPLGMNRTSFNPLSKFNKNSITPTEQDVIFRKQRVQGTVHDPAAAMLGGVSGHAGLFSNANDLAKLFQLYLNKGTYGDEYYFSPEVMDEFTRYQFRERGNRRALGFDKPQFETKSNVYPEVSYSSYGHTGFTGTFVWTDPERELIYIFLSNRTFPDPNDGKLSRLNVRTNILCKLINAIDYAHKREISAAIEKHSIPTSLKQRSSFLRTKESIIRSQGK